MLKLKNVYFSYKAGGKEYRVTTDKSVENKRVSLDIADEGELFSASIRTRGPIELTKLKVTFTHNFLPAQKIFLNGYQSWTDSIEHGLFDRMHGVDDIPAPILDKYAFTQYGDYTFVKYGKRSGQLHGFSYGYIREFEDFTFFGSLAEDLGFTIIRTDTGEDTVSFEKDCTGLEVKDVYEGIRLYLGFGTEDQVFDRYFQYLGIAPSSAKPIFGYTSWYRHYQNISDKIIDQDLQGLKAAGQQADVFQIDDGYQTAVGDWLSIDPAKFPEGMKQAADSIKAQGLTPGIWLAPFACEENSEIFRNKKHWLVPDGKGGYVKGGSNWSGFYALDIYNEEVREYLRHVFYTIVNVWGYKLLKLDFLYAACIMPRPDKTRGMIMSDGMKLLREYAGDAQILGCGVPLASAFGRVDYCRIGCDVSLDWNDKLYMRFMHRERTSTKNCILNTVFRRQLNGRAFLNDPDVFMLRYNDNTMTAAQRRCLAEVNALAGSILFTSDNAGEYDEKQHKLLQRMTALRGSKIISAELNGSELLIRVAYNGNEILRVYDM